MSNFRKVLLQDDQYKNRSQQVTVNSFFFGPRSIWKTMIWGDGSYWQNNLKASQKENAGDHISQDTETEVRDQIGNKMGVL
jgi:hypothetical protein